MSFLDNFSWAYQDITLISKRYKVGKYGEEIVDGETRTNFRGVIQKDEDYKDYFLEKNAIRFTLTDYEMRCNTNIKPKKGDTVESMGNTYNVIYVEHIIIEGKHDHTACIIRLID